MPEQSANVVQSPAPVSAPSAPAGNTNDTQSVPHFATQQDAMEATIRATLPQVAPSATGEQAPAPAGAAVVDAQGRKHDPVTGAFLPNESGEATPIVADGAQAIDPDPPAVVIPEGYVATPVLPEDKARDFKVFDAEGEIQAPDLKWTFTAQGKERNVGTAELLNYARHGVYNHEREQRYEASQRDAETVRTEAETLRQNLSEREQQIDALLRDPDYLVKCLTEYEQQNTPEARAQRAEDELRSERQQRATAERVQQTRAFIDGDMAPALDTIASALPTVSREELAAKLFLAAERYRDRSTGLLLPEGFQPLQQYVVNEIVPWAKMVHEHRLSERTASTKASETAAEKAKADAEQARISAQKAKRQATGNLKTTGSNLQTTPQPRPVRSQRDMESAVVDSALAAMRG